MSDAKPNKGGCISLSLLTILSSGVADNLIFSTKYHVPKLKQTKANKQKKTHQKYYQECFK
jgi:hypothetical protein